jgi:group I intron endonuclease
MATNTVNGKRYIGKTIQLFRIRKSNHLSRSATEGQSHAFGRAIAKHGPDAFDWTILLVSESNDILCATECAMIAMFNTRAPRGYNLTNGGEGKSGFHLSQETRNKIRLSHIGLTHSLESRAKIAASQTGNKRGPHSAATIEKIRASNVGKNSGRPVSEETRAKLSASGRGKKRSLETRTKIRDVVTAYWKAKRTQRKIQDVPRESLL